MEVQTQHSVFLRLIRATGPTSCIRVCESVGKFARFLHSHQIHHDIALVVQVMSPLKDGLYHDFELIEGIWDHAFR